MRDTFVFYSDPGHAWLSVSRGELEELGIQSMISPWSYVLKDFAYLEGDTDATTFIEAYEKKFGHAPKFTDSVSDISSSIRAYKHYISPPTDHTERVDKCWCPSCYAWRCVEDTIRTIQISEEAHVSVGYFGMLTKHIPPASPQAKKLMLSVEVVGGFAKIREDEKR